MATTKTRTAKRDGETLNPPSNRLDFASLGAALETFAALAAAYAAASDDSLSLDATTEATVRSIVETLDKFAHTRKALVEQRVMLGMMNLLRDVYGEVRARSERSTQDSDQVTSSLSFAEPLPDAVAWRTDEERRDYLWKIVAIRLGDFTPDELPHVDLSSHEITKRGGPKMAAQSVVSYLFDKGRHPKEENGRDRHGRVLRLWEANGVDPVTDENIADVPPKIFGAALSRLKTLEFVMAVLALEYRGTR